MDELSGELDLNVEGTIDFALDAVLFGGETDGFAISHHESNLAQNLHSIVSKIGGEVTGDAAFYI